MIKTIRLFLFALVLTPIIADNSIFSPANSNFYIRSILFLVSILFIYQYLFIRDFRDKINLKIRNVIRSPLVLSIIGFISIFTISTIFAVDKYVAFWSNIDRVEGLVGLIYCFSFFVFSLLIFKKKDWIYFFKLSLFISFIILIKESYQFFTGVGRPDSFIGNPAFLAGYLLSSIFSSIIVFSESIKNKVKKVQKKNNYERFWLYFSIFVFILSILGIFITETRSAILGLVAGFIFILIYGIIEGKNIFYKKFNLRVFSITILCIIFLFSGIFISTRKSEIWQKVPGLERVAVISTEDATTQTRLLMIKISIDSINPKENGLKKFLIGWGPDNFRLAYAKYFNPIQFDYEKGWFDRSHNKLLDVLVMNGVFGLIAYLSIFFFFFRYSFRRFIQIDFEESNNSFSLVNVGFIFFGFSYFVHLLFIFDQNLTSLVFFFILAFILSLVFIDKEGINELKEKKNNNQVLISLFFILMTIFLIFSYLKNDLPAYIQIKQYDSLRKENQIKFFVNKINRVFEPFTTAQEKIRKDYLVFISNNYNKNNKSIIKLADIGFSRADEYVDKMPLDFQFISNLAATYTNESEKFNNPELLIKGEAYHRRVLSFSSNRSDINYNLALNLFLQNRYQESFDIFENLFINNSNYFLNKSDDIIGVYIRFIKYFYKEKDKENFIKTADRLKKSNYSDSETLDKIINFINKTGVWPHIDFK